MTNHERPQIMLSNKRLPDMSWTPRTYGIVFVFCFGQNGYGPCPGSQDLFIMNRHLQPSCRLTCKVVVAFFWVAIIDCFFFGFALISAQWKNRCWYLNSFHVREWLTCQAFWYFKICTDPSKPIVVQKRWGKMFWSTDAFFVCVKGCSGDICWTANYTPCDSKTMMTTWCTCFFVDIPASTFFNRFVIGYKSGKKNVPHSGHFFSGLALRV